MLNITSGIAPIDFGDRIFKYVDFRRLQVLIHVVIGEVQQCGMGSVPVFQGYSSIQAATVQKKDKLSSVSQPPFPEYKSVGHVLVSQGSIGHM